MMMVIVSHEDQEIALGPRDCPRPLRLPSGVFREILSLVGQNTPTGRGSVLENMISVDHIIRYHPCCK